MLKTDIENSIQIWTDWARNSSTPRYDIALFKIWIQFEKFLSDLFVLYAIGGESEAGFSPGQKLAFSDENQLNPFLRNAGAKYINYFDIIPALSEHIFINDVFSKVVFNEPTNSTVVNQVMYIRNYIAHESGEAKDRLIRNVYCNNGVFLEPNDYLQRKKKNSGKTYYTYYVETISNMVSLLVQGVD